MQTIRRIALLGLFALALAACGGGDDDTTRDENGNVIAGGEIGVFSLNVGDCFEDLPVGEVSSLGAVPCADEHLFEIYHLFDVVAADFDATAIQTEANDGCLAAFEDYMGVPFETSYFNYDFLQPTAGSWAQGDREVVCVATPFDGTPIAGTAKGAGLLLEQALEDTTATEVPVTAAGDADDGAGDGAVEAQSVFDLNVGECYVDLAGGDQVGQIEPVACNEPHGIEIIALFDVDLPAYDREAVSAAGEEGCLAAFEPYMGATYAESWYDLDWLQPSEGSWGNGDREVVCVVFPFGDDITQSVGSARGEGRLLGS